MRLDPKHYGQQETAYTTYLLELTEGTRKMKLARLRRFMNLFSLSVLVLGMLLPNFVQAASTETLQTWIALTPKKK